MNFITIGKDIQLDSLKIFGIFKMLNFFGIIVVKLVELLSSSFLKAKPGVQESYKVDDNEKDEGVILKAVKDQRPKGIFDKVHKPICSVAKCRASGQSTKRK